MIFFYLIAKVIPPCLTLKVSKKRLHNNWECVKQTRLNSTAPCLSSCPIPCEDLVYSYDVSNSKCRFLALDLWNHFRSIYVCIFYPSSSLRWSGQTITLLLEDRARFSCVIHAMPWVMMPWWRKEPVHDQPWYLPRYTVIYRFHIWHKIHSSSNIS